MFQLPKMLIFQSLHLLIHLFRLLDILLVILKVMFIRSNKGSQASIPLLSNVLLIPMLIIPTNLVPTILMLVVMYLPEVMETVVFEDGELFVDMV